MILGVATQKGIDAINSAISSNGVFLTLVTAKLNNAVAPIPTDTIIDDLPAPAHDGYINSVVYDKINKGLIIQAIFDRPAPLFKYNSCGIYDHKNRLLFYSKPHMPMIYHNDTVLRYYFFIPLYDNISRFDNIRIVLPENKIVHHVYEFKEPSIYWRAQHNLLTPFIQFTVYNSHGQVIKEDDYDAYVTPGFLHITFKKEQSGYISLQGEGYSLSIIQGEQDLKSLDISQDYESKVSDDIRWIDGTLLS